MDGGAFSIPAHAEQYSVVLLKESGGAFLVQRRARRKDIVYAGRLGLFGGRQEPGETPEACAVREVEEECGLALRPSDLSLLARLLAHDEFGNLSFGHVYVADELSREQTAEARRFKSDEGRVVLLQRADIDSRWRQLTSITSYAFMSYFDYEASRRPRGGVLASFARMFSPSSSR
jgi:8-oxo-dGTP pyrophosphatase MutT (NUDIX family)